MHLIVSSFLFLGQVQSFTPFRPFYKNRRLHNGKVTTKLNYVQTDEKLEERLKEVQQQWDTIKSSGLKKFFIEEITSAEKSVQSAILSAEKAVESTLSAKFSELNPNMDLVNTMKAAEIVADAAATSVKADALGMNDLAVASKDVVESIKASETAVQSVIDKISAGSNVDGSDVELLEKSASDLMKAMEVAQSIATNVGQSAVNDALSLQKLESMGYGLLKELDYVEKLAEASFKNEAEQTAMLTLKDDELPLNDSNSIQGHDEAMYEPTTETNDDLHVSQTKIVETKDNVEIYPEIKTELSLDSNEMSSLGDLNMKLTSNENIVQDLENASKNVVDEMQIVENTAKSVANNALEDARAISSLRTETNEVVDSIRSFQTTIEEATKNPSLELGDLVKATGSKTLDLIKIDEENAEMISEVVTKDAQLDAIAANSIERADKNIDDLINAAASMIDETSSDSSLVNSFEDLNDSISESIKVLNNEVEHCSNCARIEDVNLIEEVIGSASNMEPNLPEHSIISLGDSCTIGLDNVPLTELMHAVRSEELVTILSILI